MVRPDFSDISIVVLSYNRRDVLARNLISLTSLAEETGCELIVVDNASTDGSAQTAARMLAGRRNARFIGNEANLGVAGGRNAGWRAATRDFLLNIDDDTLITAEAVGSMLSAMQEKPELGIVSPCILDAATGTKLHWFDNPDYGPSSFSGGCHLVRRAVLDSVGFYDEACTFGGEELDLSIRTRVASFEIGFVGHATVLHDTLVRKGQEEFDRSARWTYSFIRVHHKHFPQRVAVPFSLRYLATRLAWAVRTYGPVFGARLLGPAMRGFLDGRRLHSSVPDAVVRFYSNPDLRPDFGNVPLLYKLLRQGRAKVRV